jgi:hypothetical protein
MPDSDHTSGVVDFLHNHPTMYEMPAGSASSGSMPLEMITLELLEPFVPCIDLSSE